MRPLRVPTGAHCPDACAPRNAQTLQDWHALWPQLLGLLRCEEREWLLILDKVTCVIT